MFEKLFRIIFFYMRAAETVFINHVSYSLERKEEIIVPKSIKFS